MTATTTPALELAGALFAIAEHLVEHPHLAAVNMTRPAPGLDPARLQIAGFEHLGEPDGIPALLDWAKSLDNCRIWIDTHKDNASGVWVEGVLDGVTVLIWDVDYGDLYRWRGTERRTPITLEQLDAYVAAGTVEHADEHATALTPELLAEAKHWAENPLPRDIAAATTTPQGE